MAGRVARSLGRRAYSALAIPLTEPLPITKPGAVSHVIPEVEVSRLSTGLVVSSVNNLSPISKVSIFVEGGSRHETYANRGATHFLRSSSYLTTKGASSFRIVRGIGDVGGKLHVSSGREHMIYSVDCLTDKVETLMEYLVNVTTAQEFRIWELATVRARVRLEKALAFQSPQIGLVENLHNVAYKNALQNSIFCPADMVDRITPTMIQEFVQNHFTSGRIALVGIGVSHADLKQLGEQFLNVRGGRGSPIAQAKYRGGEVRQQTSGEYVHAAVVVESAPVGTVESKAFLLLQHVLGMGPNLPWGHSAGRLWHAVAKETAQSFAVSSLNFAYSDSGLFGIYSVCAPTATTKVIRAALAQVKAVADGNLTEADVARARALAANQCVRYLLERGAQVDSLKSGDWTPLMLACTRVNVEVLRELISWGAQLNLRNKDGWNAFQIACRQGDLATVCFLLQASSDIWMTRSKVSRSPLHTAALHGHLDVVDILLQRCSYGPDERDSCGVTPFMDALKHGHVEVARLLMDRHKPDKRAADALGAQALHQAAMTGQDHSIRFLITELGVDVNSRATSMNLTALHYAAKEGHTKTILTLCDLGADLQATDAKGRTARLMASAGGHAACAQALDQTCMQNHTSTTDFTTHGLPPKLLHQSSSS